MVRSSQAFPSSLQQKVPVSEKSRDEINKLLAEHGLTKQGEVPPSEEDGDEEDNNTIELPEAVELDEATAEDIQEKIMANHDSEEL